MPRPLTDAPVKQGYLCEDQREQVGAVHGEAARALSPTPQRVPEDSQSLPKATCRYSINSKFLCLLKD